MEIISGEEEAIGYRKLTKVVRRDQSIIINKKRVYRLCKALGVLQPQRVIHPKHPRKLAQNHEITASNQLWEVDVKYVYITGEDRFCFLMSMIDVFDREIIDYHLGLSCTGEDAKLLLQRCLWRRRRFEHKTRPIIRTDNGPQFISGVFEQACLGFETEHERIPPKTPNMNAHIESFHAQLERERLTRYDLGTYQDAYRLISDYMYYYNQRRMHGSLFDLSPFEFQEAVSSGRIIGKAVTL